jgi:hypothetical protein
MLAFTPSASHWSFFNETFPGLHSDPAGFTKKSCNFELMELLMQLPLQQGCSIPKRQLRQAQNSQLS